MAEMTSEIAPVKCPSAASGFAECRPPPGSIRRLPFLGHLAALRLSLRLPLPLTRGEGTGRAGPARLPGREHGAAGGVSQRPPSLWGGGPPGSWTRRERRHGASQRRTEVAAWRRSGRLRAARSARRFSHLMFLRNMERLEILWPRHCRCIRAKWHLPW